MSKELKAIQQMLLKNASNENLNFFNKVVPGIHKKMYGVKTLVLNEIVKHYKDQSFDLAEELWQSGAHEERIIAIKILEKKGKSDPERLLKLFKQFAEYIDNWAICDGMGMQFLRSIVKTHSKDIFGIATVYNKDKNFWKRRLSLVMVEWYTRHGDKHEAILNLVKPLENDEAYYVRKAVAWINRNFEKRK
ncbi:MAG: DNA alkylation repair protein [Chitinophagaceae bacterium]|nr:DNA alkylation repair protein [Chitinophagaceae bacterium]